VMGALSVTSAPLVMTAPGALPKTSCFVATS
jgi:hypothetical protein